MQSAIALCFSEKAKDDKFGKALEEMAEYDPDGKKTEPMPDKEMLKEILRKKYPQLAVN